MAGAFRSASYKSTATTGPTVTVSKPAGVVDGDVIILIVKASDGAGTWTTPAGWVLISNYSDGTARYAAYWHRAASDASTYSVTYSTNVYMLAAAYAFSGVLSSGSPIAGDQWATSGGAAALPSMSYTASADSFGLWMIVVGAILYSTATALPSGYTQVAYNSSLGSTLATGPVTAGSYTVGAATISPAQQAIMFAVALLPPIPGPTFSLWNGSTELLGCAASVWNGSTEITGVTAEIVPGSVDHTFNVKVDHTKVTASLTDFPLYVDLSNMPAAFWSNVSDGGGDIRAYAADGTTALPREVVSCNTATSTGELHVKTDLSSTADTTVIISVDGIRTEPAAATPYGAQAVWSNGYAAVWHLDSEPASTNDATANANNSTTQHAVTSTAGKFGAAGSFNGTDSYVGIPTSASFSLTDFTVSAWMKSASGSTDFARILAQQDGGDYWVLATSGGQVTTYMSKDNVAAKSMGPQIIDQAWHLIALSRNTTTGVIGYWVDGVSAGTVATTSTASYVATTDVQIGGYYGTSGSYQYFGGTIDEARIVNVARSAAWLAVEYANQNSPATFYSAT